MSSLLKKIMLFELCKFKINYSKLNPKKWKRLFFKKMIKGLVILIIFLGAVSILKDEISYQFGIGYWSSDYGDFDETMYGSESVSEGDCNTMGIELHGDLVTYITPDSFSPDGVLVYNESASEDIVFAIETADKDESIKAILLEIDSYGGWPVAAEEVATAMKMATKPTVVLVRSAATSAAYWAATGADNIFASSLSDIGSIGITMSYLDSSKKNTNDGLTYNSLSTGKFKDYGDPNKPLTPQERELLMRDLSMLLDNFINAVAENRNLEVDNVKQLADGSSMPGEMALRVGLIDGIGGMTEVKDYLKEKIGEEVQICW